MFIRKKKINGFEYAYLVENRYSKRKKQSRQKSTKYLGRVINLGKADKPTEASTAKEALINELINLGFKFTDDKLIKEGMLVDLKTTTVTKNNKQICLEINEGFLCNSTLNSLLSFSTDNQNQREIIHNLANIFVSAGINLHHESFVKIFNNTIKT